MTYSFARVLINADHPLAGRLFHAPHSTVCSVENLYTPDEVEARLRRLTTSGGEPSTTIPRLQHYSDPAKSSPARRDHSNINPVSGEISWNGI
ncbi:MAG TPA: hypothetical protein VGR15_09305 [Bacteroidota bacterium]|nr:hypothetical protein [Bacteroidota bacterium]